MASLSLTLLSETAHSITLGWTPVSGAAGYVFLVDGKRVSNTWDAADEKVTFSTVASAGEHTYEVQAVAVAADGSFVYPVAPPPPPPPPPPSGFAQLPVGPFVKHSSEVAYTSVAGTTISKLDIENIPKASDGLMVMQWPAALSTSPYTISDVITQNIGNVPPTSNGTSEAGIWIGQTANVNRVVCDGSWEGLWTGAECADSVITNFTVGKADGQGGYTNGAGNSAGLYLEHFTRRTLFQHGEIHSLGHVGIISEWWYPDDWESGFVHKEYPTATAGQAGSCHNTFDTLRVYCPAGGYGIYLDAGTWGCTIKNITFWGPGNAYHEVGPLAGPDPNVYDQASCTYLNGGSKIEQSIVDPNRKPPATIAWREAMTARFAT